MDGIRMLFGIVRACFTMRNGIDEFYKAGLQGATRAEVSAWARGER